jgi:hypothetical protein
MQPHLTSPKSQKNKKETTHLRQCNTHRLHTLVKLIHMYEIFTDVIIQPNQNYYIHVK